MEIEKYYNSLEPKEKIELVNKIYDCVYNDKSILHDEDTLDQYAEFVTSSQEAIIEVNRVKNLNYELVKQNQKIITESEKLKERDSNYDLELENLKNNYINKIRDIEARHKEELTKIAVNSFSNCPTDDLVEELKISTEVNNFVMLKTEDFLSQLNKAPDSLNLFEVYRKLENSEDIKIKILASNFLTILKKNEKDRKITKTMRDDWKRQIQQAINLEKSKEVVYNV